MPKRAVWVLVADGGRARVHSIVGGELDASPVFEREGPHLRSRDIGADRPGRTFAAAGSVRRSAIDPKQPLDDTEERRFLATIAEDLDRQHQQRAFDGLVLVAAPRALGTLRAMLTPRLSRALIATSDRDLVRRPVAALRKHLAALDGVHITKT
jgi:protein required for attachment to host cells